MSGRVTPVAARVEEISVDELRVRLESGATRALDVREPEEWAAGRIMGATHLPQGRLVAEIERHAPERETPLALYCAVGSRSRVAARTLKELGYTNVVSVTGGLLAWRRAGFPVEGDGPLDAQQRERYSRHLRLPEVGVSGQAKLLASRVLLIGAGGLGSPAALYLAAAGVGMLGIVDFDVVERSNLQRQILHGEATLGGSKVASAREMIGRLNPEVRVVGHEARLDAGNALDLFRDYDVILNGSDNFPTRYLVSDAAVLAGKPVVDGSILQFEGQLTVYNYRGGPTFRSLFPVPPAPDEIPNCAEGGVLGVVAGVIGTLQALEALKILLGIGDVLSGRLLLFDALAAEFRELHFARSPDEPTVTELIDYEAFCNGK